MKKLSDVIKLNARFCRSININQDLDNAEILSNFICPTSFEFALLNITENVSKTGQAAFTWTGPYGSGKSSLALFLSALLGKKKELRAIASNLLKAKARQTILSQLKVVKGWEVLPIVGELKDAQALLKEAIAKKTGKKANNIFNDLEAIAKRNDGLLIFIDEMGKCLESAARGSGDVYFFQQLAEFASRSNGKIILIGILHQAFAEYARYLPHTLRDEWLKIQGRFVDMPINTVGEEQIELISRAISTSHSSKCIVNSVESTIQNISKNKVITSPTTLKKALVACWPVHPIVVSLLAQISRKRFGQNQRSIFSFLSSGEPKAFRDLINSTEYADENLYMPEDLFDYLRYNLESAILSSSDSKIWNVAVDALARCQAKGASDQHIKVLKTMAVIDLFNGASGLSASEELLRSLYPHFNLKKILKDLSDWSVIILKKHLNAYSIYEGSDFDIEAALNEAYSAIPSLEIQKLADIANFKPIIAKRHYHKFGCMRWFDVLLTPTENCQLFLENQKAHSSAVGFFNIFLPRTGNEEKQARAIIRQSAEYAFPTFMTIAKSTQFINEYLKELLALEWIQKNKSELHGDSIARREIESRRNLVISLLEVQLNEILMSSEWYENGRPLGTIKQSELSSWASSACDHIFSKTPKITSELVNRTKPSGSANTALNTLLKDMVLNEGEPVLGITGFTPERGLFNILLQETGLYAADSDGKFTFKTPTTGNLKELWKDTTSFIKSSPNKANLADVYQFWAKEPFGIKAGIQKFLALAYIMTKRDSLAVYKDNVYIPQVDDIMVDYLMKEPKNISFKLVEANAESRELLTAIENVLDQLSTKVKSDGLVVSPLLTARKLVQIVDTLPPWVLKTKFLSKQTTKFREIVKVANDPYKLLFEDLPAVFADNGTFVKEIATSFKKSMEELLQIYPNTMKNIALMLTEELDVPFATPTALEKLRERAKKIKGVSGNFRLEAFASRISTFDSSLAAISGIVSLANSKPPQDWIDLDIENAKKEILSLCTEFKKTELYAKVKNKSASRQAVAFIAGIGKKTEIIQGEFDILVDMHPEVIALKKTLQKALSGTKNKNVLLEALTELTIEHLRK